MIDHTEALSDPVRLERLAEYDVDSPELKERLDALAAQTAVRLGLPVVVGVVMDSAHLFLGTAGLDGSWAVEAGGTPSEWAFCSTTVVINQPYLVFDTANDPFHHDNPMVTVDGVGAYAGVPLRSPDGQVLGATCTVDARPRVFSDADIALLESANLEASAILEEYRVTP